ncbi:bifunctional DNA primase/polymerase [Paenibacillus timonensis]|uniref:bifunctional DNA primase/polymerase n=1 Tax=Paenibacillus timonensis TaxID=225915 RepID=UPI003F9B7993
MQEINLLTSDSLNKMTTGEAAFVMAEANFGPKYLPVCASDHQGESAYHGRDCERPGKAPILTDWRTQASDDPLILEEWYLRHPNRNIGMTLGAEVGIIGFDVDGEYGVQKMDELFDGVIPTTWQFSTPGGGARYLFKVPRGPNISKHTDTKNGANHEELALLADGQMTVIPPSRHQNGGQYRWISGRGPGDIPIAALPSEILDKVRSLRSGGSYSELETKRQSAFRQRSDSALQTLTERCQVVREAVTEQDMGGGCSEDRWHAITSMLVRGGHPESALEFSRLSGKHNRRSELRIRNMEDEGANAHYGPTRCITLGCQEEQITRCHGNVRRNKQTGEMSNTPVALLSRRHTVVTPSANKLTEYTDLISSAYEVKNDNLCLVKRNNDGTADYVPLANFVARIAKNITKDDGAERTNLYEIDGLIISSGKKLSPILVPASEFDSMKWLSLWGPEPNISPGNTKRDMVRHAIQTTADKAVSERTYAHLGWVEIEGGWRYLHANGALDLPNVKVETDTRLKNYALPDFTSNSKEAMTASLKLLDVAPRRVTLVLWSLVFLSPLCEMLRGMNLEPKFLVWLYGYTGSRKTTLAKLFLSHFGDLLEHPPASFKDTANSVEKRGFDAKDSLLLIDDYHPTSSPRERKSMEQLAQQILRGYGDRVARGRTKQDTTLRQDYPPRGMAIVTAEDMITGGSSVARLFPAELLKSDVNLERLTEAQQSARMLSEAMTGFLGWVAQTMNASQDGNMKTIFAEKRNEAARLGVHGRLTDASALLYIGLHAGLGYAESIGAIEIKEKGDILNEAWGVFCDVAAEQGEQVNEKKASTRFITIVSQLLSSRSIYCDNLQGHLPETIPNNSTLVGWHDSKQYYFLPDTIYNHDSKFLSERAEQFPITPSTLWKELADAGITNVEKSKEGGKERTHFLAKKSIRGDRKRLLCVKKAFLKEESENPVQPSWKTRAGIKVAMEEHGTIDDLDLE